MAEREASPKEAETRRNPTSQSGPALRKQISSGVLSNKSNPSPRGSRNTSPLRKDRDGVAQPSAAAAIQRALSASNIPQLADTAKSRTTSDSIARRASATPETPGRALDPSDSGPTTRKATTQSNAAPSISIQSADRPSIQSPRAIQSPRSVSADKSDLQTPKNASRGPSGKPMLETVDENTSEASERQSAEQAQQQSEAQPLRPLTKLDDAADSDAPSKAAESGSDSGGKSDGLTVRTSHPPRRSRNSYTSLAKAREGSRNMTVETETVQSIPHSGLTDRSMSRADSGTVKMKSSNETIRPKKERRQPSRKARSQGTASSKADLFEARVANAVDEANSSDSDETFVYESNPPDTRRPRHHSRTPSVTSAHSTTDLSRGIRSFGEALDERRVAGKRSMKFSNNPFQSDDSPSDQNGTVRSHQARHYGRWGRGGSHASMFEDSPFTQASKLRGNTSVRQRPDSPRSTPTSKKTSPFDFDAGPTDDERTPLMGSVRTPRRHVHDEEASIDFYTPRRRCSTMGSFLLGVLIFAMVVVSTVGFLMASNRPLASVYVRRIDNVLATEQEILLDLRVGAVNPNALSIAISDLDITMVAKSKYKANDTDADLDDDDKQPLLTLGHIMHFDQALEYGGTPFQRRLQYSVGGLHLSQPGNKTATDGSARWAKMLEHPFELILRGVLRYKLPISARDENIEVTASVIVHPEDGVDATGKMRLEPVDHSDHWQWIDWEREKEFLGSMGNIDAFE